MSARVPLSILHVVAPAPFGGLESVLRSLAAGHVRRGHFVRVAAVLSSTRSPHPFVEALSRDGVPTTVLSIGARDYVAERRAIRALCRDMRPEIVHTHGFRSDVVDGAVARSEGLPVVSTCHGFIEGDFKGRLYQTLQRRALRRFDAVIAVSAAIAARLRAARLDARTIHLIPNAFSRSATLLSREAARAELGIHDGPAVGWVGRLSLEKGPDLALEALARARNSQIRLVVIGDGRERAQLLELAHTLGVADRITWCGAVADAGRFFRAFDAFLLSSRTEGTPISLLEAMAANVPIIAASVGGVPQVVDDRSASLVPAGDVDAMAAALDRVIAEPSSSSARAVAAGRRLDEQFAIDAWLDRHEALYRSVIGIKQPPA